MSRLITLLTDFGPGSPYVGQMHAVIARRAPELRVLDLAHDCPRGGTEAAAYILRRSYGHCPDGTVHVVVVDPGVGTPRAILAASASGHLFVGPDNGVLSELVANGDVRRIENQELMLPVVSHTFHGRDIMAPVAAHLATGTPLATVGPPALPRPVRGGPVEDQGAIAGKVLIRDRYGNLITNVPRTAIDALRGGSGRVRIRVGAAFIDGLVRTFGDVAEGQALAYIGSGDNLEIAVNGGRAAEVLRLSVGDPIRVEPA